MMERKNSSVVLLRTPLAWPRKFLSEKRVQFVAQVRTQNHQHLGVLVILWLVSGRGCDKMNLHRLKECISLFLMPWEVPRQSEPKFLLLVRRLCWLGKKLLS
jgi:hypothetical protein